MERRGRGVPRMGRAGMGMGVEDWQLGEPVEGKTPARERSQSMQQLMDRWNHLLDGNSTAGNQHLLQRSNSLRPTSPHGFS